MSAGKVKPLKGAERLIVDVVTADVVTCVLALARIRQMRLRFNAAHLVLVKERDRHVPRIEEMMSDPPFSHLVRPTAPSARQHHAADQQLSACCIRMPLY